MWDVYEMNVGCEVSVRCEDVWCVVGVRMKVSVGCV